MSLPDGVQPFKECRRWLDNDTLEIPERQKMLFVAGNEDVRTAHQGDLQNEVVPFVRRLVDRAAWNEHRGNCRDVVQEPIHAGFLQIELAEQVPPDLLQDIGAAYEQELPAQCPFYDLEGLSAKSDGGYINVGVHAGAQLAAGSILQTGRRSLWGLVSCVWPPACLPSPEP